MGWAIAFLALFGAAVLPLGFRMIYDTGRPDVWVLVGPLKLHVYPVVPKEEKTKVSNPKATVKQKGKPTKKSSRGGSIRDFEPVIKTIIEFLSHFRRKIRVNHLEMNLILAGSDPCDLAVNYGKAWIALGNIMPQLERVFCIKKRNMQIQCDFSADKTLLYARIDATITLGRTLYLLSWHGIRILKELLKLKKIRKGGANL